MKINRKSIINLFMRGVRVKQGMPAAVESVCLQVLEDSGIAYETVPFTTRMIQPDYVRAINRDHFIDCTPHQMKELAVAMREAGDRLQPDRSQWRIVVTCLGSGGVRRLSVS
jgi:hypothetical protein